MCKGHRPSSKSEYPKKPGTVSEVDAALREERIREMEARYAECVLLHAAVRRAWGSAVQRTCKYCQKKFMVKASVARTRTVRFCSLACKMAAFAAQ